MMRSFAFFVSASFLCAIAADAKSFECSVDAACVAGGADCRSGMATRLSINTTETNAHVVGSDGDVNVNVSLLPPRQGLYLEGWSVGDSDVQGLRAISVFSSGGYVLNIPVIIDTPVGPRASTVTLVGMCEIPIS